MILCSSNELCVTFLFFPHFSDFSSLSHFSRSMNSTKSLLQPTELSNAVLNHKLILGWHIFCNNLVRNN
ncbi:hypothetical protein CISIN_1g036166mg [Citrus sinensis]|uniref:Uncharacterized protein n=1 Tax=Citrus sinensis TaxID=2711 RepID=A0A067F395_CITSI|nr:hypothetical protein CISIN_1g036166mg [Citrus sinensis]